jgi:hypothetical protein
MSNGPEPSRELFYFFIESGLIFTDEMRKKNCRLRVENLSRSERAQRTFRIHRS